MRLGVFYFPLAAFIVGVIATVPILSDNTLPQGVILQFWSLCLGSVLCYSAVLTSVHEDVARDNWTKASFIFWMIGVISMALILPFIYFIIIIVYGILVGKAISESLTYDDVLGNKKEIVVMNAVSSTSLAVIAYFT